MSGPAVVVLSRAPLALAQRLAGALGGELHAPRARVDVADRLFDDVAVHLRSLFAEGRPIVALMATGAVVRILAPLLADKRAEPPVVALAEDGSAAVPLLGGHRGANALARQIAALTGGIAAVTTAGDLAFGVALDAPPAGYVLENVGDAKAVMAELVAGEYAWIEGAADWLSASGIPVSDDGRVTLSVDTQARAAQPMELLYRPRSLVLGVGAERGAPAAELIALCEAVLAEAAVSPLALACLASIDLKSDEHAVHAAARHFGVPARFLDAATLEREASRLENPSDTVFRETGCHGVAEGAALSGTGPLGRLLVSKRKGARTTAALGEAPAPVDPAHLGHARGRLLVLGIGPGDAAWRSPEVSRMAAECDAVVGYTLYLDLLGPLLAGKPRHDFALGEEERRVRHAIALAAEGRTVALVSSGDAGIYAMATLVFELLDRGALSAAERRIAVEVSPGISALQAAAARAGAPLGHDFCTISLSDLLTPWDDIRRRVEAAATADFAVAFYNPVSLRRRHQLAEARAILLRHRAPETPVVVASQLGRPAEAVHITTLGALTVEEVDMLTIVIVGSTNTRLLETGEGRRFAYTPRGYSRKTLSGIAAP